MKWIKAADRLPTKAGPYFIRNKETYQKGICHFDEETGNFTWGTPFEWLDESPALVEDRADGWIRKGLPEKREGWSNSLDVNILIYHDGIYTVSTGSYSYQLNKWCDYLFNDKYNEFIVGWQPLPPPPNPTITNTPE